MKKLLFTLLFVLGMMSTTLFASADAGDEQFVYSNDTVQLDGTNSTPDKSEAIVRYRWKQLNKRRTPVVVLSDKKSATPTFIAPIVDETTELRFRLKTVERYKCKNKCSKGSKASKGSKGSKGSYNKKKRCKRYKTIDIVSIFVYPEDSDNNDTNITGTSVTGTITDTNGTNLSGASVTIGTQTVITGTDGSYTIMNVTAGERVSINVTHPDYLTNSRIVEVGDTDVTLDIKLGAAKATFTFSSADGGIASHDGASVELPVNGYVDSNGSAYTGDITVKMSYYPITTQSGRDAFPGTFEGIEGNTTFPIQSYGFMNVELTDPAGNPLNLDGNSTATLTFPRDNTIYSPSIIPLWYYDEAQGYWVEEGQATNAGHYSTYVGTVTHFTAWNLDAKGPRAKLTGCVEDTNGAPVANANVQFRSINWDSYVVPTDANGSISVINILAQENLTFSATAKIGNAFYYGEYPSAIYLAEGEDRLLADCVVLEEQTSLPGTVTVTGILEEYDYTTNSYQPVANGAVDIYTSSTLVTSGTTSSTGTFSITFQTVDALLYYVGSRYRDKSFTLQSNKSTYDVGNVRLGREE